MLPCRGGRPSVYRSTSLRSEEPAWRAWRPQGAPREGRADRLLGQSRPRCDGKRGASSRSRPSRVNARIRFTDGPALHPTDTLDRPYACSVCAKTFARQSALPSLPGLPPPHADLTGCCRDTLNRHVRLHTRSEDGAPAKPRRRRIKSISTGSAAGGPSSGPRTFTVGRTSFEAKGANGLAQPLASPASSLSTPLTPASAPAHLGIVDGFGHLQPEGLAGHHHHHHGPSQSRRNSDAGPTSYLHHRHLLQHPAMYVPETADHDHTVGHHPHHHALAGRVRERGFSLSAIDETAAHHHHHHHPDHDNLGPFGSSYSFVPGQPGQHPSRPAFVIPSSQPEICPTSLLAQYPLAAPSLPHRPALFIGTSERGTGPTGGGAHWDVSGWMGGQPASAHSLSSFSEHMMDHSPTFAGMTPLDGSAGARIDSDVTSPSDSTGSELPSRKASSALAAAVMAAGGNSFGLTGVAAHQVPVPQPPTMIGDGAVRKDSFTTTSDWMRYLAAHELAHPSYQKSFVAPTMLADGTEMRGEAPSPFMGNTRPMLPDVDMTAPPPAFGRGRSPYDGSVVAPSPPGSSCASHRGYGSSGDSLASNGMFAGPGPGQGQVHRPHLSNFRPGSTGSSVFTRDRVSLSSSLQTDVSAGAESWRSGKHIDEDPTLAPADLARSRSSNPSVPFSFEGLQATAPGIPHLGMPNSLSFLAFGEEGARPQRHQQPPGSDVPLGEAVDDWRARTLHPRPPTLDGSAPVAAQNLSPHPIRGQEGMFLPLLDHDTTPNASAPGPSNGFYQHVTKSAGMLTPGSGPDFDRMSSVKAGFFRAEPQTAVQVLHSPAAPADFAEHRGPSQHQPSAPAMQAGLVGGASKEPYRSPWPLTPEASPPSAQTDPTAAGMGRIEDASAARESMRIDLEDLVAVELAA